MRNPVTVVLMGALLYCLGCGTPTPKSEQAYLMSGAREYHTKQCAIVQANPQEAKSYSKNSLIRQGYKLCGLCSGKPIVPSLNYGSKAKPSTGSHPIVYNPAGNRPSASTRTTPTQSRSTYNRPVQAQSPMVYATDTGTKYHRDGCQYLTKSRIPLTLIKAKSSGLGPCSRCKPQQ